jgi:hypothetical protein
LFHGPRQDADEFRGCEDFEGQFSTCVLRAFPAQGLVGVAGLRNYNGLRADRFGLLDDSPYRFCLGCGIAGNEPHIGGFEGGAGQSPVGAAAVMIRQVLPAS